MRKFLTSVMITSWLCLLSLSLSACAAKNTETDAGRETGKESDGEQQVILQASESDPASVPSYRYGMGLSTDQGQMQYEYTGEPIETQLTVTNDGDACEIGLLLYLDGIPVSYETEEDDQTYMAVMELDAGEKKIMTVQFTPPVGERGQTAYLSCVTMLNPEVIPYTYDHYYIGFNHQIISIFPQEVLIQGDTEDASGRDEWITVESTAKSVTDDGKSISSDRIGTYIDGVKLDHSVVADQELANGFVIGISGGTACADSGNEYLVYLYGDHQLLSDAGIYLTKVQRNEECLISIKLSEEQLKDLNNIYAIAVPTDGRTDIYPIKTDTMVIRHEE